jgi:hypothetical protein
MKRRLALAAAVAAGVLLLAVPVAVAKYRGSDVLGNIAPDSVLGGGALMNRYPLSALGLDYHVDAGVTNPGGVPAVIAQWAAAQLWSLTSFLVKTVIELFTWAFSLNLLAGTGGGVLAPVAQAVQSLYANVIGQAWMILALTAAGMWGIWKALVQRRYTETAGALALSACFVVIALFFVEQPTQTIGRASQWTNTLSLAFLSGANQGTVDNPARAKQTVADQLFRTQILEPWVVLEFGGLRHCVNTNATDPDGFPKPVAPTDPARTVCRDHLTANPAGYGGYAPRFLRYPPGSPERDAEYQALKNGHAPVSDPQFKGAHIDKADAPAVDIEQADGAFQRLTLAVVIFVGSLGAVSLLGFLSLAVILAQVIALVLLGFAPVVLIVGVFPGRGHDFFRTWLAKLASAIFIKALYSLVIAVVVAVAGALAAATGSLGFLFAFALQAIFYWALFLYRRQITSRLVTATTGQHHEERLPRMSAVQRGADLATRPFSALVSIPRRSSGSRATQESALGPPPTAGTWEPAGVATPVGDVSATSGSAPTSGAGARPEESPATSSPPPPPPPQPVAARAQHGHDTQLPPTTTTSSRGSAIKSPPSARADSHGHQRLDPDSPRDEPSEQADIMRGAHEFRDRERQEPAA